MVHKQITWHKNGKPCNGAAEIAKAGEKGDSKMPEFIFTHPAYSQTKKLLHKLFFTQRFKTASVESALMALAFSGESEVRSRFNDAVVDFLRDNRKRIEPFAARDAGFGERLDTLKAIIKTQEDMFNGQGRCGAPLGSREELALQLLGGLISGSREMRYGCEKHLVELIMADGENAKLVLDFINDIKTIEFGKSASSGLKTFVNYITDEHAVAAVDSIRTLAQNTLDSADPFKRSAI